MRDRVVVAEALDQLPADDPDAMRSRRDLRRVHRVMATRSIVASALRIIRRSREHATPLRILELGAGDGSLMLGVARSLAHVRGWSRVELTLLDRLALLPAGAAERYARVGWTISARVVDVLDWVHTPERNEAGALLAVRWDVIVANLFLHHFTDRPLAQMLGLIAERTRCFFACEPRRAWLPWAGSHLVGVLGVNAVTREDAVLSVRAGFRGRELSAMWPRYNPDWRLREYSAGLFSHCFLAERVEEL